MWQKTNSPTGDGKGVDRSFYPRICPEFVWHLFIHHICHSEHAFNFCLILCSVVTPSSKRQTRATGVVFNQLSKNEPPSDQRWVTGFIHSTCISCMVDKAEALCDTPRATNHKEWVFVQMPPEPTDGRRWAVVFLQAILACLPALERKDLQRRPWKKAARNIWIRVTRRHGCRWQWLI